MRMQISQGSNPLRVEDRKAKLKYMQSIIREVRDLSAPENCAMVTYFLELAYIEVSDEIRKMHEISIVGRIPEK